MGRMRGVLPGIANPIVPQFSYDRGSMHSEDTSHGVDIAVVLLAESAQMLFLGRFFVVVLRAG